MRYRVGLKRVILQKLNFAQRSTLPHLDLEAVAVNSTPFYRWDYNRKVKSGV